MVKSAIGELVQNLKEAERKRDESAVKLETLQRAVAGIEEERANLDTKLRNAHAEMNEQREQRREVEERLNSSSTALSLQVGRNWDFVDFSALAIKC